MYRLTYSKQSRINITISIIIALLTIVSSTLADNPWEQKHKLLATDGQFGNNLGESIAIDGELCAVGAPYATNSQGTMTGAVYVFNVITGKQIVKLLPDDGQHQDLFGRSLAISGNLAVVGSMRRAQFNDNAGSIYFFDVTTGQQLMKIYPADNMESDYFGGSITIDGNRVVAGASGHTGNNSRSGAVYIFDATTGQQISEIFATNNGPGAGVGGSVAIDGNTIAAGAIGEDAHGLDSGSAYLFDANTGQQLFKLLPQDGAERDRFGNSIDIQGNLVLVGAYMDDDNGTDSGSAYLFDATTGQQLAKLLPDDGQSSDQFGFSVALNGNFAFIGSLFGDGAVSNSGAVYVFDVSTGQQVTKLIAPDGKQNDFYGNAVSVNNNCVAIGAKLDDDVDTDAGAAYIVQQRTTNLLDITPNPLIAGQNGHFIVNKANPNQNTWLVYSINGTGGFFSRDLNVVIDLQNPQLAAGPKRTNVDGNLLWGILIPGYSANTSIWFQSVQFSNKTNVIATQIVP